MKLALAIVLTLFSCATLAAEQLFIPNNVTPVAPADEALEPSVDPLDENYDEPGPFAETDEEREKRYVAVKQYWEDFTRVFKEYEQCYGTEYAKGAQEAARNCASRKEALRSYYPVERAEAYFLCTETRIIHGRDSDQVRCPKFDKVAAIPVGGKS